MSQFLTGALAMGSFAAGLFFFRFWRDTHDRLFAIFGLAFWILGVSRVGLAIYSVSNEEQTWLYWLRLLAFVLILVAIIDKNRPHTPASSETP